MHVGLVGYRISMNSNPCLISNPARIVTRGYDQFEKILTRAD